MKKLIAMTLAATLVLSSAVYASDSSTVQQKSVDVVTAATDQAPAPAPAPKPAPKPTTKPTTTKPAPKPTTTKPAPKPTTTKPATTTATGIMKLGSKGAAVVQLQTLLNKNGFTLKADGIFGKQTLAAVKSYQAKNGLKADGIVGTLTLAKLNAVAAAPAPTPAPAPAPTTPVDTVTSASIVGDNAAFEKAISANGKWIIAITKDLTFDKPLVLTGNFTNTKPADATTGLKTIQRKLALYSQDDKHNVTARFTLTAPKLTVLSPNASIQHGTFKGDLYVGVSNFKLVDAVIDGNVYFANKDAQATFQPDATSKITGKQELVAADAVTSASIVNDNGNFEKAIAKDGKWIIAALNNLTFDKELTLTGNFTNTKPADATTGLKTIQRKIALYTQDDKHVTTGRFILTAPKLTILSPNASIQKGTFKGDLYVGVPNFQLVDAVVDGNVYFTNKDAMDTFKPDATSLITGKQELVAADAVTSASIVNDNGNFEKAISKDGKWIIAALNNLTFDKELTLTGNFTNTKPADATTGLKTIQRKIALYTQDDKHVTTGRFMLTAPKLTILSPNASIQKGIFKGDLYVGVPNFQLVDAVVDGNIYFTNKDAMDTFKPDATSLITGKQELVAAEGVDAVASASIVDTNEAFEKAISKDGNWIVAVLKNLVFDKELVVAGDFHDKNDATKDFKHKLALYSQDDKHVTTGRFMLTAPKLDITSPNATIQKGIFKGDIYVFAKGFNLVDAVVDGNIYFITQEAKDTFTMDATSLVTGKQEVKTN